MGGRASHDASAFAEGSDLPKPSLDRLANRRKRFPSLHLNGSSPAGFQVGSVGLAMPHHLHFQTLPQRLQGVVVAGCVWQWTGSPPPGDTSSVSGMTPLACWEPWKQFPDSSDISSGAWRSICTGGACWLSSRIPRPTPWLRGGSWVIWASCSSPMWCSG